MKIFAKNIVIPAKLCYYEAGDDGMFSHYMSAGNCHLKFARGKPAVSGREFHNYDEMVLFLEGNAQLISKNIQICLSPGSIVLIPKEQFHQFVVTDHDSYTRCILGFGDVPQLQSLVHQIMTEVAVVPNPSEQVRGLFETLMQAAQTELPKEEQALLLQSAVAQLLFCQRLSGGESIRKYLTVSPVTQEALRYIDENLSTELRLDIIAQVLGVSVSSLSHRFRKDLSISVYRYISEKRLSAVRQYMEQGISLGTAAERSGFKDYSGFFRLYKSYYGESPSATVKTPKD